MLVFQLRQWPSLLFSVLTPQGLCFPVGQFTLISIRLAAAHSHSPLALPLSQPHTNTHNVNKKKNITSAMWDCPYGQCSTTDFNSKKLIPMVLSERRSPRRVVLRQIYQKEFSNCWKSLRTRLSNRSGNLEWSRSFYENWLNRKPNPKVWDISSMTLFF